MNASAALAGLRRLGKPVVSTDDAALALGTERSATAQTLRRLAAAGLLKRIRRGLWVLNPALDPLVLPEYLTAPFPSYVSLQSALFLHGMIGQIPAVIYIVSLAQTRRVRTSLGTFSLHRVTPRFFGGYDTAASGVRLATPEKALLDVLYLTPARSRLFAHLPEIEIPRYFDRDRIRYWVGRIPPGPRRRAVEQRLDVLLADWVSPPSAIRARASGRRPR